MNQLDDLLSIWESHKEKGEAISAEQLCRDNPELLAQVRWHIQAIESMDAIFRQVDPKHGNSSSGLHAANDALLNQEFHITNRYQIQQHHASGGLGDVFIATDPILNRKVAIKFPRQTRLNGEQRARFEREARITGQLDHPGIVAVHSLKLSDQSQPCYVMRFVQGPTLHKRAKEFHEHADAAQSSSRFSSPEFRELLQHFVTLCNIVGYAHDQGVIHRDIKPSNVILGPFGQTYLMDWGLARADRLDVADLPCENENAIAESALSVEEHAKRNSPLSNASTQNPWLTKTGQMLGTPAFASPEQQLGNSNQIDQRSDVYSLGASLCFVLTGKLPVESATSEEYLKRITTAEESLLNFPSSVPRPLVAICRAATHVAPALRYPSPIALAQDIQSFMASESISVLQDTWGTRALRWMGKNRATSLTAGVAAMLLLVVSGIALAVQSASNRKLETAIKAEQDSRVKAEQNAATARDAVKQFLVRVSGSTKLRFTYYQRALDMSQELVRQSPDDGECHRCLAHCNQSMGALLRHLKRWGDAEVHFQNAVEAGTRAVELLPIEPDWRMELADYHMNLAYNSRERGESQKAREHWQEALTIYQKLVDQHPANPAYHKGLGANYCDLGRFLGKNSAKEAFECFEKAEAELKHALELDSADCDVMEYIRNTFNNKGTLLVFEGRVAESIECFQLARKFNDVLKTISSKPPPQVLPELAEHTAGVGWDQRSDAAR